jgi:hypothetical protein
MSFVIQTAQGALAYLIGMPDATRPMKLTAMATWRIL